MKTEKNSTQKSRTGLVVAGALAGLVLISGVALAAVPGGPGGPRGFGHGGPFAIMRVMEKLDLTDQQELQLIKIRKSLQSQGKEARQEMTAQISQVLDELEKPAPDAARIHGVADQAVQRFSKILHSGIDQILALHSTFTPEQRQTLVQTVREHQARMEAFKNGERPQKLEKKNALK